MNRRNRVYRNFAHENVSFGYHLILEERKTMSATVFPSQTLLVKAPQEATDDKIHDFLRRKYRWILKQKRYFAQFGAQRRKSFISGEKFQYRGRSYKLLVSKGEDRVSLHHGTLKVYTPSPGSSTRTSKLLDEWFAERAYKAFSERLSACFPLFDYDDIPSLSVRRMTRRWGSYSQKDNRIILNCDLIKASTRHIDYVIIHELCHITHRKHNRDFHSLLESKLPQWRKLKTELELRLLGQD